MQHSLVKRIARHYRQEFGNPRQERLFISSLTFLGAFGAARAITHAIQHRIGPFHNLSVGGRHLHHLVFGIGGLLAVGYLWLVLVGTERHPAGASRATAAMYGVGSALTLDEFALWLNLQDVYWAKQGRESIDAVAVFGALLSIGVWGGPFWRALVRDLLEKRPRR
jgi:phosphate/sulfate permease